MASLNARSRRLPRALAFLAVMVACSACTTGPYIHTTVHRSVIELAPGALEHDGLAFITPTVVWGKEEDKQVVALTFAEVMHIERPEIRVVTLPETLGLVNSDNFTDRYKKMYDDYLQTGILKHDAISEIGRVTGARYLAQVKLASFGQESVSRFGIFGLRVMETKRANIRLFLQIWDSDSGRVAWEGVLETNYSDDTMTERVITFRTVVEEAARELIRQLP
jgi:hypothetical protein